MSDWAAYFEQADEALRELATGKTAVIRSRSRDGERWLVHHGGRAFEVQWQGDIIGECLWVGERARTDLASTLRHDAEELPPRIAKLEAPPGRPLTEQERAALRAFTRVGVTPQRQAEIARKTDPGRYHELLTDHTITLRWGIGTSYRTYGPCADPAERARQAQALLDHLTAIAPVPYRALFYPVSRV